MGTGRGALITPNYEREHASGMRLFIFSIKRNSNRYSYVRVHSIEFRELVTNPKLTSHCLRNTSSKEVRNMFLGAGIALFYARRLRDTLLRNLEKRPGRSNTPR